MRKLSVALLALALSACWTEDDCTDVNGSGVQLCQIETNLNFGLYGNTQKWTVQYYYADAEQPPIGGHASLVINDGRTLLQVQLSENSLYCTAPGNHNHHDPVCGWLHGF